MTATEAVVILATVNSCRKDLLEAGVVVVVVVVADTAARALLSLLVLGETKKACDDDTKTVPRNKENRFIRIMINSWAI